jgi:PAS domain S-box-containing protein
MKNEKGTGADDNFSFSDIFDLNDIQHIQDLFADATGVASIITYPDGTPITRPSNFSWFCNEIIRKTEIGLKNCLNSDAEIGRPNSSGPTIRPCFSCGLWDAGASIIVGDRHLANWLVGQVKNDDLDREKIIEYAKIIGADEKKFIAALEDVTVMSKEKFFKVAQMLFAIANELSSKAYQNRQLIKSVHDRNQAEDELIKSEILNRTLIKHLPQRIFIKDTDSKYILSNEIYSKDLGINSNDIVGRNDFDFFSNELAEKYRKDDQDVIANGIQKEFEEKYAISNRERWTHVNKVPYRDADGKIVGVLGIFEDITERKLAEEELRISHEKYQSIFESTGTATLIIEEDSTISLANHECFSLTGYSQEELIGQKWTKYVETESLQNMIKNHNLRRIDPSLAPKKYEVKLIHKNGETRYAMLDIGMVHGSGQSIVSILDITDRILAEKALLAKAEELERFNRLMLGRELKMIELKKEIIELSKISGKNVNASGDISTDITKKKLEEQTLVQRTMEQQRELSNKKKTEKELKNSNNHSETTKIATINLLEDIKLEMEQRKKVEKEVKKLNSELEKRVNERTSQLEEVNSELQAFAYSVSHDLRAPLRAIDGFSKFILEDYSSKLDDEGRRLLGLIRSNTIKMDKLITDILSLSRVTRSEQKKSKIDMTKMALSMFNEAASDENKRKMKFVIEELPDTYADATYIKQVWINLISNAVKFSSLKKVPKITIGGYSEEGRHVYYVRDNGEGFNPEYTHKLFGVFQRLHGADEFEGTGVGLAIVQRIIHRHGGTVWAEGKEGKGATFYFSLPSKRN